MKKIFYFTVFIVSMFSINVYASNEVDYKLTITDDFKFNEVISYSITDYKQVKNGENYFYSIINDDIYTDILYNTVYKKTKVKTNNGYKVKLSNTYNEYTLSNSNFLNNCFEKSSYNYNIDNYSFEGKDGFYCLNGDSLKITIITNMDVESSNAIVSGNKYQWIVTDENFTMNMKINKNYVSNETDKNLGHGVDEDKDANDYEEIPEGTDVYDTDDPANDDNNETTSPFSGIIIAVIFIILSITAIIIVIVLKQKKSNLNKI